MDRQIKINDFPRLDVFTEDKNFEVTLELESNHHGVYIFKFNIVSESNASPEPITLRWKIPSFNMKGVWKPGGVHDKRQQYDWELVHPSSRISVDAPVLCVFGHDDNNVHTVACSDAINLIEMNALLREEDNHEYFHITFFSERHPSITSYSAEIRIDTRSIPFSESLQSVSKWWEDFEALRPHPIPEVATMPLYSSWYSFHQDLDAERLISECRKAYDVGYELIILDDGWQTMDNNRGYDYTGDWKPDRFPDMAGFVKEVQATGMKFGLWYSVPFCGKHSEAYKKFKGKFLTENHRWAPVFDPRYPEVRDYLQSIYVSALKDWNLDAFKLDFIDDFKVYPETILTKENGRDYANVNEAVDKLLTDVMEALRAIKPDIGIEFRQQYVGPALRKYGNMFRAFDCPNDVVSNRIRITDVKLLCGNTAVHSDPQTWHIEEKTEVAALQVLNGLYAVPQMSMFLDELPEEQLRMVRFYTEYWKQNSSILMTGKFNPKFPLSNYPILESHLDGHTILSIYEDFVPDIRVDKKLDIINAKMTKNLVLRNTEESHCSIEIYDCLGNKVDNEEATLFKGLIDINIPACGIVKIRKL